MDIDQLISDYANFSVDYSYNKDMSKHELKITENLKIIAEYLNAHADDPASPLCRDLMEMGYWLFVFRDCIPKT